MSTEKLCLKGRIPSKKNSKIMVMRGKYPLLISSPAYKAWHTEQSWMVKGKKKYKDGIDYVKINFWFPDARKCDLSNKAESIMDLLVDNGIIPDDSWQHVPVLILASQGIDRENPRAEIEIKERDSD